jgi:hypothetical protein
MSETPQESPCECGGPQACCCNPDTCTCARCWGETPQAVLEARPISARCDLYNRMKVIITVEEGAKP